MKVIDRLFVFLSDQDGCWLERLSLSRRRETKNNDDAIIVATHYGVIYPEELDAIEQIVGAGPRGGAARGWHAAHRFGQQCGGGPRHPFNLG